VKHSSPYFRQHHEWIIPHADIVTINSIGLDIDLLWCAGSGFLVLWTKIHNYFQFQYSRTLGYFLKHGINSVSGFLSWFSGHITSLHHNKRILAYLLLVDDGLKKQSFRRPSITPFLEMYSHPVGSWTSWWKEIDSTMLDGREFQLSTTLCVNCEHLSGMQDFLHSFNWCPLVLWMFGVNWNSWSLSMSSFTVSIL